VLNSAVDRAHLCDLFHCGKRSNRAISESRKVAEGDRAGRADVVVTITGFCESANSRMALVSSFHKQRHPHRLGEDCSRRVAGAPSH